MTKNKQLF